MKATTIQALDFRRHIGEYLNQVHYQGKQVRIARKKKVMAWMVGDPFMKAASQAIGYIIKNDPALADTLAITLDDEIRSVIEQGTQELKAGKTTPLEDILDD